ncbi:MAG: isoprenylcysteine carboxylmethyltransferase family protein, partial [bacterium]|nr:isoprenylcysteine carboxylmethyltransferase family protein [bacterium]
MGRMSAFIYGTVCYVAFLVTFLYMIGFVNNLVVPKSIDMGSAGATGTSVLINLLLLGLFAVQHTIMARPPFKRWWTKTVPEPIERSTFVLVTCLVLGLMVWQWRPMAPTIWQIDAGWARTALIGLSVFGFLFVVYSSFLIDHFDLFGVRQVTLYLRGRPYTNAPFMARLVYRYLRHPLMLGFLIAFWATPHMTTGHLLFAGVTTVYIFFGVNVEERDLAKTLGDDYLRYR